MHEWKQELSDFFDRSVEIEEVEQRSELCRFIEDVVGPAFTELRTELENHGRNVTIRSTESSAALIVQHAGEEEMSYRIQGRTFPNTIVPYAQIRFRERKGLKYITVESMLRSGPADYELADITAGEIIKDFLQNYMRRCRAQ